MTVATRMRCRRAEIDRIMGPQFTLTRHFVERWRERVGNEVHIDAVKAVIKQAVMVQQGRKLINGQGHEVHTLSLYWHPEMQMVISVDRYQNTAVSVLTGVNAPRPRGGIRALIEMVRGSHERKNGTETMWKKYGARAARANGGWA